MPLRLRRRGERTSTHEQQARDDIARLTASRRAIAEAYEVERRRIERDLHDGTQQHLVAALMLLGEAQLSPALTADPALGDLVAQAKSAVAQGLDSLRVTVRGIHPRTLTDLGLEAALREAAGASPAPVAVVCPHPLPQLPASLLAAAYFFACEVMTNAAKHAPGAPVSVLLAADQHLHVSVVDEGPGGARVVDGHGLAGMRERLAAFGGTLDVASPAGGPTQVRATFPLLLDAGQSALAPPEAGAPTTTGAHPAAASAPTSPTAPKDPA